MEKFPTLSCFIYQVLFKESLDHHSNKQPENYKSVQSLNILNCIIQTAVEAQLMSP